MDLHILEHRVRVLSVARRGLWLYTHPLVKLLFLPQRCRCKFFSLTETPEDYTIMLDEEGFKELPPSEFMQVADSTWLVLNVVSNGRASSSCQATGVTKIAKSVIVPLAEHNVSVLMLSTYQTDFILVREKDLPVVIHTLAGEFDIYKEENGEAVPVNCSGVSNGFLKPKPAISPTVHPVQSPQNRFCILTVAPDMLPSIATMLIDVLFYSPRFPSDLLLTSSTGELWRMVRIGGQPLGFDPLSHQTSAESWPKSPSHWLPWTSQHTTSAPSTLIMPWSPRMASPRSSRCSRGARRVARSCCRRCHGRTHALPTVGYSSSGSASTGATAPGNQSSTSTPGLRGHWGRRGTSPLHYPGSEAEGHPSSPLSTLWPGAACT
ncbi:cytosolic arginine sensor for mTORC1 subunit 1 isoform X3 [Rhea pennata]|uniref:cytosolic arginine sensor for mTORC1 subunit 1 isoform X3 n=1 Tax=Rhea pennata TaxID=8795 RepID=UPI002E262087